MAFPPVASEHGYAKINLALQLIDRLPNGYHRLDSVVSFVGIGDNLQAEPTTDGLITLHMNGEFSDGLPTTDNLVIRAAKLLQRHSDTPLGARITLQKDVPVGAGLGGGSADAAATLRLLNRLWRLDYSLPALAELSESLGADVPACIFSHPLRMEGIGEHITPMPQVPRMAVVLVYPHEPLWTPEVYGQVQEDDFSGQLPPLPHIGADAQAWNNWLVLSANDLMPAAFRLSSSIRKMLAALAETDDCLLARMSGSGSACFALYAADAHARAAADKIKRAHPGWWVRASSTLG